MPGVVGAEIVQVEIDGILNKSGKASAAAFRITPLHLRFHVRRQVEGKFLLLAHQGLHRVDPYFFVGVSSAG